MMRRKVRIAPLQRLKGLAVSAWGISFISFAVTALTLQSHGLTVA
jgi:hypothetical protein